MITKTYKIAPLVAVLCSPTLAQAQGIPTFDVAGFGQMLEQLSAQSRDLSNQREQLTVLQQQTDIEQQQIEAFERMLGDMTGRTDISGLESGASGFPSAAEVYPAQDDSPMVQRLFDTGGEEGEGRLTVERMIVITAERYQNHPGVQAVGLSPTQWRVLFQSLVKQESGFNQAAMSPVGAIGLCQLMPPTAAELGVNPYDPLQNLDGGARYIAQQMKRFGRIDFALAAYNAGAGNVNKYGGIPPFKETQNYVVRILGYYDEYMISIGEPGMLGTMSAVYASNSEWANMGLASQQYAAEMDAALKGAMTRTLAILKQGKPANTKAAVDWNTYIRAEVARILALRLRMRAAEVKVETAEGMASIATDLTARDFYTYSEVEK